MGKLKIVVCGTGYGKAYLAALCSETAEFELAGILARGSDASQQMATTLGVPLYQRVEQIPQDIDIACVAIKATILGGQGTDIAMQLMSRGIHVLQEHPIHAADVVKCIEQAKKYGVQYQVNSHFAHVQQVGVFIDYVRQACQQDSPLYVDVCTSLTFSTLDILAQALGGLQPFSLTSPGKYLAQQQDNVVGFMPFTCLSGLLKGIPLTLRLQNHYAGDDSTVDDNLLVMHRLCVGFSSGNVTLLNTHGPVVWSAGHVGSSFMPAIIRQAGQAGLDPEGMSNHPSAVSFSPAEALSVKQITCSDWPDAILRALKQLRSAILDKQAWDTQQPEYLSTLSQCWMTINRHAGVPQLAKLPVPQAPYPEPLAYALANRGER